MTPLLEDNELQLGAAGGIPLVFLLRDEFSVPEASPVADPHNCDVIGVLRITDTASNVVILSHRFRWTAQTTPSAVPRAISSAVYTRARGLMVSGIFNAVGRGYFGFDSVNTRSPQLHSIFIASGSIYAQVAGGGQAKINTGVIAADFEWAIILRATGAHFFLRGGYQYSDWTRVWVDSASAVNVYAGFGVANAAGQVDELRVRVAQLGAPYVTDDFAAVTQRIVGSVGAGTTFVHEADCLIEFIVTTRPTAGIMEVRFRIQDATNYWRLTINSVGDLGLDEVVGGVPTPHGSSAATITNGNRVLIIPDYTDIRVFRTDADRILYASATNFVTRTDGVVQALGTGGVLSNLIAWQRNMSGTARAELEKYAAGDNPTSHDSYTDQILATSPIAYWPCDEIVGSVAHDLTGNRRAGQYTNAILGQPGKYGNCAQFQGVLGSLIGASSRLRDFLNVHEYSVAAWIKVQISVPLQVRFINIWNAALTEYSACEIRNGDDIGIFLKEGGVTQVESPISTFPDNTWAHLVFYNSNSLGKVGIYYNGVKIEYARTLGGYTGPNGSDYPEMFNALLGYGQHVAFYDHALTQAEVNAMGPF